MKKIQTAITLALVFSVLPAPAQDRRNFATNAVATVDMSVVILKSETKKKNPPTKEELILEAKEIYNQAISNSYIFNNSEELQELISFIKKHKLEDSLKKEVISISAGLERTKYEIEWSFFSYFVKSKGIGLLDQKEFEVMRKKLIDLQKIRAQKSKMATRIKSDMETIKYFEDNYQDLRQKQVETSRKMCKNEIDWSESFSARRSQTETGWCYAFGYADYLESTQKQSVSAADLVLQFKKMIQKETVTNYNKRAALYSKPLLQAEDFPAEEYIYKGGDFERIFRKNENINVCAEENLRSEAKNIDGQPARMGKIVEWINELGEDFKEGVISVTELELKLQKFNYKEIFPKADLKKTLHKLKDTKKHEGDLYILLAESTCDSSRVILPNQTSDWVMQGYTVKRGLESMLEKVSNNIDHEPIVVSINDNFLYKENIWGKSDASNHIVLITGKRWNEESGHCEFKVRNSQTVTADKEEKLWYSDTELLRNVDELYITPLINLKN